MTFRVHKICSYLSNTSAFSDEEEVYAWEFAYHLIDKKSFEHENDIQRKEFVYHHKELKQSIANILKDRKPEIRDAVMQSLSI
jgi:hypothetical protein